MSSYVNPNKTKRVNISDTEWIDIRAELSVKEIMPFARFNRENMDYNELVSAVSDLVVNWDVVDSDGNTVPFSKDRVSNLSVSAFMALQQSVVETMKLNQEIEKKNLPVGNA